MATHLFAVGERVSLSAAMRNTRNFSTVFTVKNRLPHVGTRLQYRIRAEAEPHDRVVTEEQLSRVGDDAGGGEAGPTSGALSSDGLLGSTGGG